MSTLVAQTISNGTVSTSSANVIQGSAKAWVNFDGTTGTRRASYNVSSVTRSSTGIYIVNFTTALADANYSSVVSAGEGSAAGITFRAPSATPTTTTFLIETTNSNQSAYEDASYVSVAIFR